MAAAERVTLRELVVAFFRDPWRKLVALLLAVLMWHYLDAQVSDGTEVGLTLVAAHEAGDLDTSKRLQLFVRMDLHSFGVIRYEDPQSGDRVEAVQLFLVGAKRAIQTLDENPGFTVRVEPTGDPGNPSELIATFDAGDVQPINPRFEELAMRMVPPRISVRVGRNVDRNVILGRERIDVSAPANRASLLERIVWEDARFQPEAVTLRGPEPVVDALTEQGQLFLFDAAPIAPGSNRLEVALRAAELPPGVTLNPETVSLKVPLRVEPNTFRLLGVPVLLFEPQALRGKYRLRQDTADVEIEASGTLEARLSGLSQEEIREWAKENALLVASLPRDAGEPDVILNPQLIVPDYVERIHFRVSVLPAIHFDRKTP